MTRFRAEAALAVLFAAAITLAGGAAIYFVFTMSVHTGPKAVPSTVTAAPAERYSSAVEEARRLARSLVVEENLPGLSVAVALDGRFDEVFPLPPGWERMAETADCTCTVVRRASGGAWGIQPHPEIGLEEGLALQASYLETMPERRKVLEAGWHAALRDDRIAAVLVTGFLNA